VRDGDIWRAAVAGIELALLSPRRRSAEEYVAEEDWSAVAQAINQRMAELGLTQAELVKRSHLSKAIVREVQHNVVQRRRSSRTLEAISIALEWHPGHLAAVLSRRWPPRRGEPHVRSDDDICGRLAVIEHYLRELAEKVDGIAQIARRLDELNAAVEEVRDRVATSDRRG
jgi:hypothetical protein